MKAVRIFLVLLILSICLFLQTGFINAQQSTPTPTPAQSPGPPVVVIESPKNGVTSNKILTVSGTVSDPSVTVATIIHNGESYRLRVRDGNFYRNFVAYPGENTLEVVAENAAGQGRATSFVRAMVEPMDMKVVLTWDKGDSDIDLWVTDPKMEKCYYGNPNSAIGGSLDLDVTDGYGPETFTLPKAIAGNYLISAHYYGNSYSGSASPISVKVEVVMFGGTPKETRKVYSTMLHQSNTAVDLANVLVQ